MIYDQHGLKFRYYLRRLTKAEHVASVYHHEMEKLQNVEEKKKVRELSRWYSNWDTAAPALLMDMKDHRKDIEYRKWLKRHSDKTFFGPAQADELF